MTDKPTAYVASGERLCLILGALLLAVGVVLGAFTTHALKARLGTTELGWWETGVQYHMWTAVGLVALSARAGMRAPALVITAGALFFSGSLYVMALTGWKSLPVVAATPLGGLLMIAGWLFAAWKGLRART
jgi:uncharacterized membrane protein YgdD (TMEM256/DUF423 family)